MSASGNVSGTVGNTTLSVPTIASHSHPSPGNTAVTYGRNGNSGVMSGSITGAPNNPVTSGDDGAGQGHDHPSALTFSGTASSVLQPYLTIKYIGKCSYAVPEPAEVTVCVCAALACVWLAANVAEVPL